MDNVSLTTYNEPGPSSSLFDSSVKILAPESRLRYHAIMQPIGKFEEQLLKIREASEEREAERRARERGLPYLAAEHTPVKIDALRLIPEARAHSLQVAVFEVRKPEVAIAIFDNAIPGVTELIREFEGQGLTAKLFIVSLRSLEHLWSFYKFVGEEKAPITSRVNIEREEILRLTAKLQGIPNVTKAIGQFDFKESSVTIFLEIVLAGALANRVSDIHFEPSEKLVKLRYRIDGLLHDVASDLSRGFYPSIISRIKLLSNLKINVSDRPQDGRFTIGVAAKDVEIRVALAPSEFGEIIVMRVLDPDAINLSLRDLGFREDDLAIIETELKRPNGMILNTGPTGSGKTTTLYAFLKAKYTPELKIITVEDPIEYHVAGIEQTQVNEEAGYTFANGLKSIMRQDPDAILIGEVRDKETAEIAMQAALTGHLVFSTVHANDAAGAIPRFLDLGVKPTSLGPALNLIIAQRLVRRLCTFCRVEAPVTDALAAKLKKFIERFPERVHRGAIGSVKPFKANGCDRCNHMGYKGRVAIIELLSNPKDSGLEELILKQSPASAFQAFAVKQGMVTMQEDGVLKIISGVTTFEEVEEVTGPIAWR